MKRALFFDLDGTLWDALIPLTQSWNQAMEDNDKHYRFTLDTMKTYMGLTPLETVKIAFTDVSEEEGLRLFDICLKAEIKYLAVHPGKMYLNEEEIIKKLSSLYPLYIISNCEKRYIENYLNALNMSKYFTGHVCIGDTGFDKWKNIIYLKEKEKIDQVIYIGDTLKDKVESEKAGVDFIHAAYGFGKIDDDVHHINSLKELPGQISIIFNSK